MNTLQKTLALTIGLSIVLPLFTLFLPVQEKNQISGVLAFRIAGISTSMFACLHLGAAVIFWLGLKEFKKQLRHAYRAICLGILLLGMSQFQFPILSAFDLWGSAWVTVYGLVTIPGLIAAVALFFGIRSFAHALNDKNVFTSPLSIVLALIGGVSCSLVLDVPYKIAVTGGITAAIVGFSNAYLVLRIKHIAGPAYTNALAWFFLALFLSALGILGPSLFDLLEYERGPILALPIALAGMLFVKAGYAFNKIQEY